MIHRTAVLSAILLTSVIAWGQRCLDTRNDMNGPCVATATLPNGDSLSRRADGTIWLTVGDYRFQTAGRNSGEVTGNFISNIVTKIPQAEDIVEAPQFTRMEIYGDCSSKTYRIVDFGITDSNGLFQSSGPDDVTRRVMPDTPMEIVFSATCKP
jgi:hypothetical protein